MERITMEAQRRMGTREGRCACATTSYEEKNRMESRGLSSNRFVRLRVQDEEGRNGSSLAWKSTSGWKDAIHRKRFDRNVSRREPILKLGLTIGVPFFPVTSVSSEERILRDTLVVQRNEKSPVVETKPFVDFTREGPFKVSRLPQLEHTCASCFPRCVGDECLLKVSVTYPNAIGLETEPGPPYPLVIFSPGFLVNTEQYHSYANHLASHGFVVVMYNKRESAASSRDDVLCANFVQELVDWAGIDPSLKLLCDNQNVMLAGHSRGGKVSILAAARDSRVKAVCLIDPVDNTVYAPLGPGYPSAVAALAEFSGARRGPIVGERERTQELEISFEREPLGVAVVGGRMGGDCAPVEANFERFFDASGAPAWEVSLNDAGHFQFLDAKTIVQSSICAEGPISDVSARCVAQGVCATWAEWMLRKGGIVSLTSPDSAARMEFVTMLQKQLEFSEQTFRDVLESDIQGSTARLLVRRRLV